MNPDDTFDRIWSRFKSDLIAARGGITRPARVIRDHDPGDEQPDHLAEILQPLNIQLETNP